MANYTIYDSNEDEINSNDINAIFDDLTVSQQMSGVVKNRKIYIESDETSSINVYISDGGYYDSVIFLSANESDLEGDLLGTEDKFGIVAVVSATVDSFTFDNTISDYDIFRVGENIAFNSDLYEIATVTDNLDDTSTVEVTANFSTTPSLGDKISSVIELSMTASVKKSLWRLNSYEAGVIPPSRYNTVTLKILD